MFHTLAYYNTVLHRAFTAYTAGRLGQVGAAVWAAVPRDLCGQAPGLHPSRADQSAGP